MASQVIENPLSGERIVIHGQRGDALLWELFLRPGGRVPSSHRHPGQRETFTVVSGQMRFRLGLRRRLAGPGDTVVVPPGTMHNFANPGDRLAHVLVETSPAMGMADLLETAAAMAQDQWRSARRVPRLTDLALFMADFEREVASPVLPSLVRRIMRGAAHLAAAHDADARYRRLRTPAAPPG